MQGKEKTPARIGVYTVGLILYAWFVCAMTRAAAGISPITSFPYLLSAIFPLTLGTTQFIVNALLVLLQIVILRRDFEKAQLLQLVASLGFSVLIDLVMPSTAFLEVADQGLFMQVIVFAFAMVGMALGLGLMTMCHLILLPGDGLAQALARKLHWDFGRAKALNDCLFVALTLIVSLIVLHRVVGIQWGTVAAALGLGWIVRLVIRCGTPIYQKVVYIQKK